MRFVFSLSAFSLLILLMVPGLAQAQAKTDLPPVPLIEPAPTIAPAPTTTLTFARPRGAGYVVLDVYGPDDDYNEADDRFIVEMDACELICTLTIPTDYQLGTFEVHAVAGLGADTFGPWEITAFTVALADVMLSAPTGTLPMSETLDLTFNLPAGAGYVVVDVYWPNGGYRQDIVEAPACTEGTCTLNIPTYNLSGQYDIWMTPGVGAQFGEWTYASFNVGAGTGRAAVLLSAIPRERLGNPVLVR